MPASARAVAITGPNTGGKTASLKTMGLAALMAKAGLGLVTTEPASLMWFDRVLVRSRLWVLRTLFRPLLHFKDRN